MSGTARTVPLAKEAKGLLSFGFDAACGLLLSHPGGKYYVSSSTVSHLFRQKLGVSFYRYVTQRRLIAAKTLIGQGQNLESVAAQIGFLDYSGFYRAFKQEYGISPRQYRKLCSDSAQK